MRHAASFPSIRASKFFGIAIAGLLSFVAASGAAEAPFEVVVVADSAQVMAGSQPIGRIAKGARLTVRQTQGDWDLIAIPGADPPRQGWIRKGDVAPARSVAQPPASAAERQEGLKLRDELWKRSLNFRAAGQLDKAIAAAKIMLDIERADLGGDSADAISSMEYLADLHCDKEDFPAALKLREEALAACTRLLGKDHWRTTDARLAVEKTKRMGQLGAAQRRTLTEAFRSSEKARELGNSGKFSEAAAAESRSAESVRGILGAKHPDYATALADLAAFHFKMSDYAKAASLYQQALKIHQDALGPEHPTCATDLDNLALVYDAIDRYAEAEPLHQRALAIRKETLGERDPEYATSLNNLAAMYCNTADYAKAESLYRQALAIRKATLGEASSDYAGSLLNLAWVRWKQGDYASALAQLRQARAIDGRALGEMSPDYATVLNALALLLQDMGDFADAEPLGRQSLAIRKQLFGEKHPAYAESLHVLASLREGMGDYAKAEPLFQQALAIDRAALGEKNLVCATDLNNLGCLYRELGQNAKALACFRQSLAIRDAVFGKADPEYCATANNVALLCQATGDYADAETLFRGVLASQSSALGENNSSFVRDLNNLGLLYEETGDYAKAGPLLQRALQIDKDLLGPNNPSYAGQLSNLSGHYGDLGDYRTAARLALEAFAIIQNQLDLTANVQSERQQLRMADRLRSFLDGYLSDSDRAGAPADEVYAQVLAWKGSVTARQQAMRRMRDAAQSGGSPEVAQWFDDLNSASRELANQSLATPKPGSEKDYRRKLAALGDRVEQLQSELAAKSEDYRKQRQRNHRTPDDIRRALPADAALVDLLEYEHLTPRDASGKKRSWQRRLVAFTIRPHEPIRRIELGPVAPIAACIENWRKHFGAVGALAVDPGQSLRRMVWDKIEPNLQGAKTVLISPDGASARFPWPALPGKSPGTYLIQKTAIAIVPIPRLLPDLLAADPPTSGREPSLLLVGGVDFGADPGRAGELALDRGPVGFGRPIQWLPLPGTAAEVADVKAAFVERYPRAAPDELTGAHATKQAVLRAMTRCRFLHFSTHGFFAPPAVKSAVADVRQAAATSGLLARQEVSGFHPDLLSGLVLAGANRPVVEGRADGILTALEVSGLDLGHVELATLSACETGLGESAGGEGLLGLQRAFQTAGAKTVVASLWKVPDKATQLLMSRFYDNLWNKQLSKLEALREAQCWLIGEGARHPELLRGRGLELGADSEPPASSGPLSPRNWAAFELSGDWR